MKRKITFSTICFLFLVLGSSFGQAEEITLEDLWKKYKFHAKSVPGFNFLKDGKHYSRQTESTIEKYDLTTGKKVGEILNLSNIKGLDAFNGYTFSNDEKNIILKSETEAIYRRSSKANFHVWNGKALTPVFDKGKIMYATFSPNADKVAFVFDNNLYMKDLGSQKTTQITNDGKYNHIINGAADWVYEEEFSFAKAFHWSPDGRYIAFMRFDESEVKEFTMTLYKDGLYPEYQTFKYPKVGEKNAVLTIHIYDVTTGKTVKAETGSETDIYFPRIKWTNNPKQLCIFRMNRHQNNLELLLTDATSGKTKVMFKEKNKYYVDIHDNLTFLKDGKHFIWTSELDGYNHIYLYDMNGKKKKQITNGEWEVTNLYGIDESNNTLYYQSTEKSPLQRHIYSINIKGKNKKLLSPRNGWNNAQFSSTFDYYTLNHSTANLPATYGVFNTESGKLIREIENNRKVVELKKMHQVAPMEFLSFKTSEGVELNAWMIKPSNFDKRKKYPVFMYEYGGPGSQQVRDRWMGQNYWWFQMLAQKGYIIACVDNRGTGGRGEEFKKMTYLQMGKYETIDQIEGAKYFASLPYVDENRIGIFGWSYGGFLSTLCILKGNDVFKAAIAVAPVTSWRWYDTIYTERFMRTEKENPDGYKDNSPVYFADRLKGNYLLIHGAADDNVHFQNTVEMTNALINNNKQFDTYFYPNRNHGIYGGITRLHLYNKMTSFILEKL